MAEGLEGLTQSPFLFIFRPKANKKKTQMGLYKEMSHVRGTPLTALIGFEQEAHLEKLCFLLPLTTALLSQKISISFKQFVLSHHSQKEAKKHKCLGWTRGHGVGPISCSLFHEARSLPEREAPWVARDGQ